MEKLLHLTMHKGKRKARAEQEKIMTTKKHLTAEDCLQIENRLKKGESLSQIAKTLGKSTSTITREIQNRSMESEKGAVGRIMNRCIHKMECQKRDICPQFPCAYPRHHEHCSHCRKCNSACMDFMVAKMNTSAFFTKGSIYMIVHIWITKIYCQNHGPEQIFPNLN